MDDNNTTADSKNAQKDELVALQERITAESNDPPRGLVGYYVWEDPDVAGKSHRVAMPDPAGTLRWFTAGANRDEAISDHDEHRIDYSKFLDDYRALEQHWNKTQTPEERRRLQRALGGGGSSDDDDAAWQEQLQVMNKYAAASLTPEERKGWERAKGYGTSESDGDWGDLDDGLTTAQRAQWFEEGADFDKGGKWAVPGKEELVDDNGLRIPLDSKGRPTRTKDGLRIAGWHITENSKTGRKIEIPAVSTEDVHAMLEQQNRDYGSTPEPSDDDFWGSEYTTMRYEDANEPEEAEDPDDVPCHVSENNKE